MGYKCGDWNVFRALVTDATHNHDWSATCTYAVLVNPWVVQTVVNHLICDHTGIGIVPASGQIYCGVSINAGNLFRRTATAENDNPN